MVGYEEALAIIRAHARPGERAVAMPVETACGYVLAEDIRSDRDDPPFHRAAMDGFAFRHDDVVAGGTCRVAGTIAAGDETDVRIGSGECVKIMTGAAVPEEADTLIPVEQTSAHGGARSFTAESEPGGYVRFECIPPRGANIAPRGENVARDQLVLRAGDVIRPQEAGISAALGRRTISVYVGPRIAFGATGEEVVEPDAPLTPGRIRNVNAYTLGAQIRAARAEPEYLGILPDREAPLRAGIRAGLAADILILSGGISAGEFDLVPGVLGAEGVAIHFRKMRVRPGHPVLFGTRGRTLVFGLPGNPVSTLYAFDQYVLPAIRVFRHHPRPQVPLLDGRLTAAIRKRKGWLTFVACMSEWREGLHWLTPLATRGSADIFAIARADCVALIPEEAEELPAGSPVLFRRLFED